MCKFQPLAAGRDVVSIKPPFCFSDRGRASTAAQAPLPPRLKRWQDAGQFISINSVQVYYQSLGTGPALLLLHGYPFSSYDFKDIAQTLAQHYRVIMLDWPGMGFSDKPHAPVYSFQRYVAVLNALTAQLGIKEADILAHDLGASIAQELLAQEKANWFRIRSLAFMNGGVFSDVYQPRGMQRLLSQSPAWIGRLLSRHLWRAAIEPSVVSVFGASTHPSSELLDDCWDLLNYQNGKQITYLLGRLIFEKNHYQHRWIHAMQTTDIPLAYICGPADPNSGRLMAERFRQTLPHSQVLLLSKEIGHWPQLEAPREVLSAFRQFQDSIQRAR